MRRVYMSVRFLLLFSVLGFVGCGEMLPYLKDYEYREEDQKHVVTIGVPRQIELENVEILIEQEEK